jgi:hypothetical protein
MANESRDILRLGLGRTAREAAFLCWHVQVGAMVCVYSR